MSRPHGVLGTMMAVAALCATAVFGASLTHLVSSPALYGAPFQAYVAPDGEPGSQQVVNGPLLNGLQADGAIKQITLGAFVEVNVNGKHVRTIAMTPVRGTALLSALDGRLLFAVALSVFGAATLLHLLLVSVGRRRVEPVLIAALVAGVLAAASLLAAVPALLAARSRPAQLLRAE